MMLQHALEAYATAPPDLIVLIGAIWSAPVSIPLFPPAAASAGAGCAGAGAGACLLSARSHLHSASLLLAPIRSGTVVPCLQVSLALDRGAGFVMGGHW